MSEKVSPKKLRSLQGLRAFAILLVFVSHCGFVTTASGDRALFMYAGAAGVSLFIALSGFLTFLNGQGKGAPSSFRIALERAKSKAGKFYPLHLITLAIALPFALVALVREPDVVAFVAKLTCNILLVQSYVPFEDFYFSFNAVSWYLSTFMLFLVLAPYIVRASERLIARRGGRTACVAIVVSICCAEFALAFALEGSPFAHWAVYVFPVARLFDFWCGCLFGALFVSQRTSTPPPWARTVEAVSLLAIAALLACTMLDPNAPGPWFSTAVWGLPSLLLVWAIASLEGQPSIWSIGAMVSLGNVSMELFLVHQLVIRYASSLLDLAAHPVVSITVLLAVSVACAYAASLFLKKLKGRVREPR